MEAAPTATGLHGFPALSFYPYPCLRLGCGLVWIAGMEDERIESLLQLGSRRSTTSKHNTSTSNSRAVLHASRR